METRMHPRSDSNQHCLNFSLSVSPRCRVFSYRDHLGNNVQHFDIPGEHNQLVIVAESIVEQQELPDVPAFLSPDAWEALDEMIEAGDYWEMLLPSTFAVETPAVTLLAKQMGVTRRDDPLMLVQELNQRLFDYFEYVPRSHARRLAHRRGHRQRQGRLPGLCPHHDRPAAPRAHSRPLCLRLSLPQPRRPRPLHARRHPRLGRCAAAASRLGGLRSHQQPRRPPSPHPHRRGPRLRRCAAHARHLPRQTDSELICRRARGSQRSRRRPLDRKLPIPEDWSVLVERAQQPPEPAIPFIDLQQMQQQQRLDNARAQPGGLGRGDNLQVVPAVSGADIVNKAGEPHHRVGPSHLHNRFGLRAVGVQSACNLEFQSRDRIGVQHRKHPGEKKLQRGIGWKMLQSADVHEAQLSRYSISFGDNREVSECNAHREVSGLRHRPLFDNPLCILRRHA
jgi:hypothetical protein